MSSQMVLKQFSRYLHGQICFRSMSSQMVLKPKKQNRLRELSFRSMSSQMVLKQQSRRLFHNIVLDLCHLKWY